MTPLDVALQSLACLSKKVFWLRPEGWQGGIPVILL
jgi:hypothetical protein